MKLLGVYRERMFSPGKTADDAAIMDATLRELTRMGFMCDAVEGERLDEAAHEAPCIVTMAQSERALNILEAVQQKGAIVINSIAAIRRSFRKALLRCLGDAGVPVPASETVCTDHAERQLSFSGAQCYWLKRADVHAVEAADVARVSCVEDAHNAIAHFQKRKIEEVLVQQHVEGEVIKFYGTGDYFSAFSEVSGQAITRHVGELQAIARRAAEAIGLDVYGGDAVKMLDGQFSIIDVNDWPSFARCRKQAAFAIAAKVAGVLRRN